MSNTYVEGNVVRLSVTFADANGAAVDPTTVTLRVKAPSGAVTSYVYPGAAEITRTAAGAYRFDQAVNTADKWEYRWEGTGAVIAAVEGYFVVEPSPFLTG